MNGPELLRIIDAMHREKNIPKDVIFDGIESALQLAAERAFPDAEDILVTLDRANGAIKAVKGEEPIDPEMLGRIAAQSAKQVMIQKIREAECNSVFDKFEAQKGELVRGTIQRLDGGTAIVSMDKSEAILPRTEQIPGESHHVGETIKAVVMDVRKAGQRVKIILSRCHPDFVRCLFENEIPEIADRTIEIKAIAREAGHRSKVAVSSIDMKVDCVGACVGVRGSRIKNIIEELGGERIDIVRWNDALQILIPNALQPAKIEEVFLYTRLGRGIVLVQEDQLSLAIGRRGQNVRLASKLVGWDIEIMTHDEYNEGIDRAERWFVQLPGITPEAVEQLIVEGFLSYTDLTFLEPEDLASLIGSEVDTAEEIIACAEEWAEAAEEETRKMEEEAARTREAERDAARREATQILGGTADEMPVHEAVPTVESLFGPDDPAPPAEEPALNVDEVFGNAEKAAEPAATEPS